MKGEVEWSGLPDPGPGEGELTIRADLEPCTVPDCGKPRAGRGLCTLHHHRLMRGLPLIAEHEQVGQRPSGFGIFGVVTRDEHGILCNECGVWLGGLAFHLRFAHEMSTREYREMHGLPRKVGLVSLGASARIRSTSSDRIESNPQAWARFTAVRDSPEHHQRAVDAAREAGVSPAGRAVLAEKLRERRRGDGLRTCTVCGEEFAVTPASRYRQTCSDACVLAAKSAANARRIARRRERDPES